MDQEKVSLFESSHANLVAEYRGLVNSFQEFLESNGLYIAAFSSNEDNHFSSLDFNQQQKIVSELGQYMKVCKGALSSGIDIVQDTKSVLDYALSSLNLDFPDNDFLSKIRQTDIVEIYDYNGSQLFRNLMFFKTSDYSLDDFYGKHWELLYERPQFVTDSLFSAIDRATKLNCCIPFEIEDHFMRERLSENRKIVKVSLKYISPLLRDGVAVAWIASSSATIVAPKSDNDSEQLLFLRSKYDA